MVYPMGGGFSFSDEESGGLSFVNLPSHDILGSHLIVN